MGTGIVDQLVKRFVDGDAHGVVALCRPDALMDVNVPQWRYQVHPDALLAGVRENTAMPERSVIVGCHEATRDGAVVEVETRGSYQGDQVLIRELWVLRTDGHQITEWITFCTGPWDSATIARHREEAPMIRT